MAVAQLVERLVVAQEVADSSSVSHPIKPAGMVGLADTSDSKSGTVTGVQVRVPLPVPLNLEEIQHGRN